MTLTAFFDDSGSEGKGPAFVLAGYLSSDLQVDSFSEAWQALLHSGPHPLQYLKMKQAHRLQDQFQGWTPPQRDDKLMEFARVIKENTLYGFTSCLFWDDYAALREAPGIPYDLLFHSTMARVVQFAVRTYPAAKVKFVFDEQGTWGMRAADTFEQVKNLLTDEEKLTVAGSPEHRNEKVFLPLQAADLIAWQTRRFIAENSDVSSDSDIDQFAVNSKVLKLLETIPTIYNTLGPDRLQTVIDQHKTAKTLRDDEEQLRNWYKSRD